MLRSLLLLLLPAAAFAQTPEVVAKIDAKLEAERAAQRAEDVEVFRRLLNKACGLPNASTPPLIKTQTESLPDRPAVGPFDGVYLPGAGAVFTLHVPAGATTRDGERVGLTQTCGLCHTGGEPKAAAGEKHSPGDWERARADVRGEKPKPADPTPAKEKAAVCEPGTLAAEITSVLAAHTKSVRHLGEKEGVTVVVTFDEVTPTAGKVRKKTYWYEPVREVGGDGKETTRFERRSKEELVDADPTPAQPVFSADDVKQLQLAELNLKAGKHAEAVEAYSKVLDKFTGKEWKLTAPDGFTPQQRNEFADEMQAQVRQQFKNFAKALLLADHPDKTKKALEMAAEFVVLEVTVTTVPAKNTAPAKLILTLNKADADAKEPKKLVKVERVNWPK